MELNGTTVVCGIIGNPVAHSLSPLIHNRAYRALGLNFVYVPFLVEDVEGAMRGMRALNIKGLSVTIPFKVAVMRYLDQMDELSRRIGAVNTIVNEKGFLRGYNTDATGAMRALEERKIEIKGKKIAIMGSGGAARAVTFSLVTRDPASMIVMGIIKEEVKKLVEELREVFPRVNGHYIPDDPEVIGRELEKADMLVNCTPVGMHPQVDESPVPMKFLRPEMVVFDVVYRPVKTKLLYMAEKVGARTVPGLDMFLYQAVDQFELFTGQKAPVEVMRETLKEVFD